MKNRQKKSNNLLNLILSTKGTKLMLLFISLSNIAVALCTMSLGSLGNNITNGSSLNFYLFGVMGALFLTSCFRPYVEKYAEQGKFEAVKKYTNIFTHEHYCKPTLGTSREYREKMDPLLTSESEKIISEALVTIKESTTMGMWMSFNLIALGISVHPAIPTAYVISVGSMYALKKTRLFRDNTTELARQLREDRNSLKAILNSGMANATIGNRYNFDLWWDQFTRRIDNAKDRASQLKWLTESLPARYFVISAVPLMLTMSYLVQRNPEVIPALAATLMRQVQLIERIKDTFKFIIQWKTIMPDLRKLEASLVVDNREDIENRLFPKIDWQNLSFTRHNRHFSCHSLSDLYKFIEEGEAQRVTIRGEIGRGKSLIMQLIKQRCQDRAFYIPVHSELFFKGTVSQQLSSGQQVRQGLIEMFSFIESSRNNVNVKIILIDEWDAHFDPITKKEMSEMIEKFSRQCIVIEVRHGLDHSKEASASSITSLSTLTDANLREDSARFSVAEMATLPPSPDEIEAVLAKKNPRKIKPILV